MSDTTVLNNVCSEDCRTVIATDCGNNWQVLTNIIAQFKERGTIQLPALQQLEDCGPVTNATTVKPTINTTTCISLENRKYNVIQ